MEGLAGEGKVAALDAAPAMSYPQNLWTNALARGHFLWWIKGESVADKNQAVLRRTKFELR